MTEGLVRAVHVLSVDDPLREAVLRIVEADVPALPVADRTGRLAGIFGEREFIAAVFPGYVGELGYAAFVTQAIEDVIEKRSACRDELVSKHMNIEHIDVGTDYSDVQVAEVFLHHRVLIVPVVDEQRRVTGVVTRSDFFKALAKRFGV